MEPVPYLDRVATRLNRLAMQRAIYRTLGSMLLAAACAAVAAYWLSTQAFGLVLAALVVICLVVGIGSFVVLRARWSRRLEAARWVEDKVSLDQRLLTLVSASGERERARLWPELEMDNQAHLTTWANDSLGIHRVPANVVLLLLGLVAAGAALFPTSSPTILAANQAPTGPDSSAGESSRSGAKPGVGGGVAEGELAGGAEAGGKGGIPDTSQALVRLKADLEQRYAGSLIAQAMKNEEKSIEPGTPTDKQRDDLPESDMNESNAQPGGVPPPENLAHLVEDSGPGDSVERREPQKDSQGATGGAEGGPEGQKPPTGLREGKGQPAPGGKGKQKGPDDEQVLLSDDPAQKAPGGTGGGPGSAKGTGPLLAPKPLELNGGRQSARFALTLGGTPGSKTGDGPGSVPEEPRSYIAAGERGQQAEDKSVRHESIPQEYESVIKRIFERSS